MNESKQGVAVRRSEQLNRYVVQQKTGVAKRRSDNYAGKTMGAGAYIVTKAVSGAAGVVEGTTDLLAGLGAFLTGDRDLADYVFRYDNWTQDLNDKLDKAYDPGKVGRFVGDVASGLGQSATMLIPYVGQILFFTGVMGQGVSSASQKTGRVGFREVSYGALSGGLEAALERYIGGAGQTLESLTKSAAKNVTGKVAKSIGRTAANKTVGKMVAAQIISASVGEGIEEFAGNIGDVGLQRLTGVDKEATINWGQAFYDLAVGMASGALMGSVSTGVQTAYAEKNGSEINKDKNRRERMLKQARYMVEKSGLKSGSDAMAVRLQEIEANLQVWDNAKDKSSPSANIALGNINNNLISAELNVLTDRSAAYIGKVADEKLAQYATDLFGVKVTVKMLKDVNNQYTRSLAMMDWAGNLVKSFVGEDAVITEEIAAVMEQEKADKEAKAEAEKKAESDRQNAEGQAKAFKEARERAVELTEDVVWNGGNETFATTNKEGAPAYVTFTKQEDGQYGIRIIEEGKTWDFPNLTEDKARRSFAKMKTGPLNTKKSLPPDWGSEGRREARTDAGDEAYAELRGDEREGGTATGDEAYNSLRDTEKENAPTKTAEGGKKTAEANISSADKETDAEKENEAETEEKSGEAAKETEPEGFVIGSEEEIKKAKKLVKGFEYLSADRRNAIVEMLRSGEGIEKETLSSVAHFMAVRPGLHVRFMKGMSGEGSHTKLKSGDRLILLDPELRHGKKYRSDVLFHEIYHDIVATGDVKQVTEAVVKSTSKDFRRGIADRYAEYYNGISITDWLAKNNKKYTEKNFDEYFKAYKGISRADVMEEIAAACMGKVMGTNGFIKEHGGNVKLVQRVFFGLRKLARALMNRQVQIGEDSDGFTLAFRDVLAYKRLYEVAFFKTAYGISGVDLDELAEKLEKRDEADKDAIPDMSKRVKAMEKEEKLTSKRALGEERDPLTEYSAQVALYDALDHKDEGDDNLIRVSWLPSHITDLLGIQGEFYIYRNHAYENMVSKETAQDEGRYNENAHYHDLGVEQMTDALVSMNDPIMTIATSSKSGNPTIIMLLPIYGKNKAPLYAVMGFYENKKINGEFTKKPHIVLTIAERNYFESRGRTGIDDIVKSAVNQKRVLYYDKKKREYLSVIAKSAGLGDITEASLNESITRFKKEIKEFEEKNGTFTRRKRKYSLPAEGGQRTKKDLSPEDAAAREEFFIEAEWIERDQTDFMNNEQRKTAGDVLKFLAERGITGKGTEAHGSIAVAAEEPKEEPKEAPKKEKPKSKKTKNSAEKVYTKKEIAKTIDDLLVNVISPGIEGRARIQGKNREELIRHLWGRMNGARNADERVATAIRFADEFILFSVYEDYGDIAEYEQLLAEGAQGDFDFTRSLLGNIDTSVTLAELSEKVGKEKANTIIRRWKSGEGSLSPLGATIALQNEGLLAGVEYTNDADALIAIDQEYERVKERSEMRPELLVLSDVNNKVLKSLRAELHRRILDLFAEGGQETQFAKARKEYNKKLAGVEQKYDNKFTAEKKKFEQEIEKIFRETNRLKEYWKKQNKEQKELWIEYARNAEAVAKMLIRVQNAARGLRDFVNRMYVSATEMRDAANPSVARLFLRAAGRGKLHPEYAVKGAQILKEWADEGRKNDPNFIGETYAGAALTQEQYEAIDRIASLNLQEGQRLSLEELQALETVIKLTKSAYSRRDQIFKDGRWQGIREMVEKAIRDAQRTATEPKGKLGKAWNFVKSWAKKGMLQFMDPLSVAAHIDGYVYDGVMQTLMKDIALAEAEANALRIELMKPFEEFMKKHPEYAKRLAEFKVKLSDGKTEITLGHAITLTEMYKREQAQRGLELSRIGFHFDDGSKKEIEGYSKAAEVILPNKKTISVKEAEEVIYRWNHDRTAAVKNLQDFGYDTSSDANAAMEEFRKNVDGANSKAQEFINRFGMERSALIGEIDKVFNETDREFIALVSDFFQTTSKKIKTDADMKNLGYTNVIEGYYFPIKRMQADMANSITNGMNLADFVTAENLSFNQKTLEGAKASIEIFNVWDVVTEHIRGLSIWDKLYLPIQNLNKVYNYNIGETTTNAVTLKNTLYKRDEIDWHRYLTDLMLDIQGSRQKETKTAFENVVNKLRSTYAIYQLGLNPQTIVKQSLSWAAAMQFISPKNMALGVATLRKMSPDKMAEFSAVAAERLDDGTVVKAYTNTEKVTKAAEWTMAGIGWMDKVVNEGIWAAAQYEIADKHPDAPVGSEKNLRLAGEMTNEIILLVQDSSDASTKSQAARSSSELMKATTMFQSSALKMFSRIIEGVGRVVTYYKLSKSDSKYQGEFKKARNQLGKTVGAMTGVAVMTALIVQLFKTLYNKDREDEEGNEISILEDTATDVVGELVGFVPVVGDVVGYFMDGYELSNFYYDTANDLLKTVTATTELAGKAFSGEVVEEWEIGNVLRKNARAAGYLTGMPVRNLTNFLTGMVRRFSPEAGYTYDTLFYNASYAEDMNKAIEKGDSKLAAHILELSIKRDKTGGKVYSEEDLGKLIDLHGKGFSVMPSNIPGDIVARDDYRDFEKIYASADSKVSSLLDRAEFKAMADYETEESSPQATAIKTLYSGYYELASHKVLGKELTRRAALVSLTDPEDLVLVAAYNKAITGESVKISGTKKEAIRKYMNSLGMDETAQAYAAWSLGYKTEDIKAIIEKDLKGREGEDAYLVALGLKEKEES